jgi:hypothetical protein
MLNFVKNIKMVIAYNVTRILLYIKIIAIVDNHSQLWKIIVYHVVKVVCIAIILTIVAVVIVDKNIIYYLII